MEERRKGGIWGVTEGGEKRTGGKGEEEKGKVEE